MANNKEISIEMIGKIAMLATKTDVDEILERKQEDRYTRCRGEITGMIQHRYNGHSPVYTNAEKVNNSLDNSKMFMEKEDNQTVKSPLILLFKST